MVTANSGIVECGNVDKANSGKADCEKLPPCELPRFIVGYGLTRLDGVSGPTG